MDDKIQDDEEAKYKFLKRSLWTLYRRLANLRRDYDRLFDRHTTLYDRVNKQRRVGFRGPSSYNRYKRHVKALKSGIQEGQDKAALLELVEKIEGCLMRKAIDASCHTSY